MGTSVRVALSVFRIRVYKDDELIATHDRKYMDGDSLVLDHYLDQLKYKTSAFWDCKAVNNQKFDQRFLDMWERLAGKYPKKEANRHFVKILLLGRIYTEKNLLKAVEQSLKYGALDHAAVENLVRQLDVNLPVYSEEELAESLKSVVIQKWGFDIGPYAELCKEAGA